MKLYRVTHINGVCGVDGLGCSNLNFGDEAEMTDLQAAARINKIVEVTNDVEAAEAAEAAAIKEEAEAKEARAKAEVEQDEAEEARAKARVEEAEAKEARTKADKAKAKASPQKKGE